MKRISGPANMGIDGSENGALPQTQPGHKCQSSGVRNTFIGLEWDRELGDLAARRHLVAAQLLNNPQSNQIAQSNLNVSASGSAVRASQLRPILARNDYQKTFAQLQTANSSTSPAKQQPNPRNVPAMSRSCSSVSTDERIHPQNDSTYNQLKLANRDEILRRRLHGICELVIRQGMFPTVFIPPDEYQQSMDDFEEHLHHGLLSDIEKEYQEHLSLQHLEKELQQQINTVKEKQRLLNYSADALSPQNRIDNNRDEDSDDLQHRYPAQRVMHQNQEPTTELHTGYLHNDQEQWQINKLLGEPCESQLEQKIRFLKREKELVRLLALQRQSAQIKKMHGMSDFKDIQRLGPPLEGLDFPDCLRSQPERHSVDYENYERLMRAQLLDKLEKHARAARTCSVQKDGEEFRLVRDTESCSTGRNTDLFSYKADNSDWPQNQRLGPLHASRAHLNRLGAQNFPQRRPLSCDTERERMNHCERRITSPHILIANSNSLESDQARNSINRPLRIPLEDAELHHIPYPEKARSSVTSRPSVRNAMEIMADFTSCSDDDEERHRARKSARLSVMDDRERRSDVHGRISPDNQGNERDSRRRRLHRQNKDTQLNEEGEPQGGAPESVKSAVHLMKGGSDNDDTEDRNERRTLKTNHLNNEEDDYNGNKPMRLVKGNKDAQKPQENTVNSDPAPHKQPEEAMNAPRDRASKSKVDPEHEPSPDPEKDNSTPSAADEDRDANRIEYGFAKRKKNQTSSDGLIKILALNQATRKSRLKSEDLSDNEEEKPAKRDKGTAAHRARRTLAADLIPVNKASSIEEKTPQAQKGTRAGKWVKVDHLENAKPSKSDAKKNRLNARRRSESRRASAQGKLNPDDEDETSESGRRHSPRRGLSSQPASKGTNTVKRPERLPTEEDEEEGEKDDNRGNKTRSKKTSALEAEMSDTPHPESSHSADKNTDSRFQRATTEEGLMSTDSEMPQNSRSTAQETAETPDLVDRFSERLTDKISGRSYVRTSQNDFKLDLHHPDAPRRSINSTLNTTAEESASQDSAPYLRTSGFSRHNKVPTMDSNTQESGGELRGGREETRDTYSDIDAQPRRPPDGKVQLLDRSFMMAFKDARNRSDEKRRIVRRESTSESQVGRVPSTSSTAAAPTKTSLNGTKYFKKEKKTIHRVPAVERSAIQVTPEDTLTPEDIEACKMRAQNKKAQRLARQRKQKPQPVVVPDEQTTSSDDDGDVNPLSQRESQGGQLKPQSELPPRSMVDVEPDDQKADQGDSGVLPIDGRRTSRPLSKQVRSRTYVAPLVRRESVDTLPLAKKEEPSSYSQPVPQPVPITIPVPVCYAICTPCPPPQCCRAPTCCYPQASSYGCVGPHMC